MAKRQGNKNATTSGRFVVGLLPKKLRNIERQTSVFRRMVEDAVIAARGELTMMDQANITTAARHERISQCCTHWLRKHYDEMSPADRLSYAKETARASAERDKSLRQLRLDTVVADVFKELYERQLPRPQVPRVLDAVCVPVSSDQAASDAAVGEEKMAAQNSPTDGGI